MLTLGNTILSMSTGAGKLSKCTLISKKTAMRARNVLAGRISSESKNGRVKLSVNHSGKLLIDGQKLAT